MDNSEIFLPEALLSHLLKKGLRVPTVRQYPLKYNLLECGGVVCPVMLNAAEHCPAVSCTSYLVQFCSVPSSMPLGSCQCCLETGAWLWAFQEAFWTRTACFWRKRLVGRENCELCHAFWL